MSKIEDEQRRAGLSDDEIEVLAADAAANPAAADAGAIAAEVDPKATPAAAESTAEEAAAAAAAPTEEDLTAPEHFAPTMTANGLSEEDSTRLGVIKGEKAAALKKMYDGDITAGQYSEIEDRLADERAQLLAKQSNAVFAQNYNAQMQQNLLEHTRANYLASAKATDGIDYGKPELAAKFERAFQLLAADPEHSGKPLSQLNSVYEEAHRMVKAQIGWTPPAAPTAAAATPAVKQPQAAAQPRAVPKTLVDMPAAAPAAVGDATMDALQNLEGDELMMKLASMPKAEMDRVMRKAS